MLVPRMPNILEGLINRMSEPLVADTFQTAVQTTSCWSNTGRLLILD